MRSPGFTMKGASLLNPKLMMSPGSKVIARESELSVEEIGTLESEVSSSVLFIVVRICMDAEGEKSSAVTMQGPKGQKVSKFLARGS